MLKESLMKAPLHRYSRLMCDVKIIVSCNLLQIRQESDNQTLIYREILFYFSDLTMTRSSGETQTNTFDKTVVSMHKIMGMALKYR